VLPAGPDTLLTGGRPGVVPFFFTQKNSFKRHHPRIGEQQGRVIPGDQRGASNHFMTRFPKEI